MKKSIKALFTVCTMALCLTFLLTGCELFAKDCEHTYDNACDTTCNLCGEAREASAHQWKDATCTSLKTCTVCGYTEGEMLPHNWEDATCITAKTCKTCGATDGSALGHEWTTPDVDLCEVQSTCSRCGATDGENKEHTPTEDDGDCTTAITCIDCGTVTTPARDNHTGGKATATELAICEVCSQPYGELAIPKITGVVIKNTDSPQYNAETRTFTVKANGMGDLPILEANGNNFDEFSNYSFLDYTWSILYASVSNVNFTGGHWIIEGNTAILEVPSSWRSDFETEPHEIMYTNDNGETWIPTGYYVVMEDGSIKNADELEAAILAGGTVKLTQDLVLDSEVFIDSAVEATLDLNGFSITEDKGMGIGLFSLFNPNAILTITGEGTLSVNGTVPLYVDEGTLIIEHGVTVDGHAYGESDWFVIVNEGGRVVINGGSFISGNSIAIYCIESTAACEINGGRFTYDPTTYVNTETHKVLENDDGTLSVMPKSIDGKGNILYIDVSAVSSSYTWTSGINIFFYDSDGVFLDLVSGTLADGVYTITEIPDGTAKVEFIELMFGEKIAKMDVPEGCNMFVLDGNTDGEGEYTGTWTTYNP
ncbi:MAG: hypothetical protein IJX58_05175 [Clostridia bacterium]|nr:hypothetical protein [Clostridia bacterium]